jgi:opacity protein-like surface antigen
MKARLMMIAALSLLMIGSTRAQDNDKRFEVELNGEVSFVSSDLNGANLNTGMGFETIFHYRFLPHTGAYAGWGYSHFNADESFAGPDMDFEQTGYVLGLQFLHPFGNSPVSWFVRAGLLYSHLETENNEGDIISDSGHGVGYQAAAGIEVSMGRNWSLAPGIKYNSLSSESEYGDLKVEFEHRYVSARIGVVKRF